MKLLLDPIPAQILDALHKSNSALATRIETRLDWLEADPIDVRAKRRQFSNGVKAISIWDKTTEWILLWEEDPTGTAVVRFLGESSLI